MSKRNSEDNRGAQREAKPEKESKKEKRKRKQKNNGGEPTRYKQGICKHNFASGAALP